MYSHSAVVGCCCCLFWDNWVSKASDVQHKVKGRRLRFMIRVRGLEQTLERDPPYDIITHDPSSHVNTPRSSFPNNVAYLCTNKLQNKQHKKQQNRNTNNTRERTVHHESETETNNQSGP